jgi:hypothetical protein
MSKEQAEQLSFDYVDIKATEGLPNIADPAKDNFVPPVIPAEMTPTDATDYLVIALIPVVCPVGYGKECPVGKIDDANTITALQNNHDALFAWATALEFLMKHHNGTSLHKLVPQNTRISHYLPIPTRDNWATVLADEIWTEPAAMSPVDDDYINVSTKVDAMANHLVDQYIATNDQARAAYQAAPSTNATGNTNDLTTALTSAFTSINHVTGSTTSTDPSTKKFNSMAFKLLCVYRQTNAATNDLEWTHPSDINEKFESIIKGTVRAGTPLEMWRSLKKFLNNLRTVNRDYATLHCELQTYNKQFWAHLMGAAWETATITESSDLLETTSFSTFNLANMDKNDSYKQENQDIISEDLQDKAGWASDARIKSSTTMSCNHDVNTFLATIGLMANVSTFLQFITCDKHFQRAAGPLPFFAQKTEELIDQLHHHEGRAWKNVMDRDYPWAWFKMAVRYANIFAMLADFALDSYINGEAQLGNDIDPSNSKMERVTLAFKRLSYDIAAAQESGEPNAFGSDTPPTIWKEVCKPRYEVWKRKRQAELEINVGGNNHNNNANNGNNGNNRTNDRGGRGRGGRSDTYGGRGAGGSNNSNQNGTANGGGNNTTAPSGKGVFVKTDPTKPFIFDQSCPVPTFRQQGQERDICLRFTTRNSGGCLWGARCNKYHLTEQTYTELPKSKQQEVAVLVNKTKNLEFANGFTPDKCSGRTPSTTSNGGSKKTKRTPEEAKETENGNAKTAKAMTTTEQDTNEGQN